MNEQKVAKRIKVWDVLLMVTMGFMAGIYGWRVISTVINADFSADNAIIKLIPVIALALSIVWLLVSVFLFRKGSKLAIMAMIAIVVTSGIYQIIKLDLVLLILPVIALFFIAIVLEECGMKKRGEEEFKM